MIYGFQSEKEAIGACRGSCLRHTERELFGHTTVGRGLFGHTAVGQFIRLPILGLSST